MKTLLLIPTFFLCVNANAKDFKFTTPGKDKALIFQATENSQDKALAVAAEKCFDHFTQGKAVSDDYGTDVINICANLRIKN